MNSILIAYDGSEQSESILADLRFAGLPSSLTAHVATVAELGGFPAMPATLAEKAGATRRATALAEQGAARLRTLFPAWTIVTAGLAGSVARGLVERAKEVSAEVIFIGSQSRSTVSRLVLGSVAQKVATEAGCSVRICRLRPGKATAPRIVVAVDGSDPSQDAVRCVAKRSWPPGTAVAVVNVVEPGLRPHLDELAPEEAAEIERQHGARVDWLEKVSLDAQRRLDAANLITERHSLEGEPKSTLIDWADRWDADSVFLGASGLQHAGNKTLGTVASALVARAHCTVEIVRN